MFLFFYKNELPFRSSRSRRSRSRSPGVDYSSLRDLYAEQRIMAKTQVKPKIYQLDNTEKFDLSINLPFLNSNLVRWGHSGFEVSQSFKQPDTPSPSPSPPRKKKKKSKSPSSEDKHARKKRRRKHKKHKSKKHKRHRSRRSHSSETEKHTRKKKHKKRKSFSSDRERHKKRSRSISNSRSSEPRSKREVIILLSDSGDEGWVSA